MTGNNLWSFSWFGSNSIQPFTANGIDPSTCKRLWRNKVANFDGHPTYNRCKAKCQVSQPAHAFLAFLGSKECLKDGELLMMPCRGSFSCFTLHADEFELIYFLPGQLARQHRSFHLSQPLRGVNESSEVASCVSVKLCRHLPAPSPRLEERDEPAEVVGSSPIERTNISFLKLSVYRYVCNEGNNKVLHMSFPV